MKRSTGAAERRVELRRLSDALGAEVRGIDLTRLDDADFTLIHDLWLEHLLLVFPGQHLSADAHVAFARRFGELHVHPYFPHLDAEHPEVLVLEGDRAVADNWHTDVTYESRPPLASVLKMVTSPSIGGDTLWTSQSLAYDALSMPLRRRVERLTARHVTPDRDAGATHPVVRVHPETGRRGLFVNRHFTDRIIEMPLVEGRALLQFLYDLSEQPAFGCRHTWKEGDVAVWDNRCTQHRVVNDYTELRRIERVSVIGDVPIGPGRTDC
jgi:taurine dioxygenase